MVEVLRLYVLFLLLNLIKVIHFLIRSMLLRLGGYMFEHNKLFIIVHKYHNITTPYKEVGLITVVLLPIKAVAYLEDETRNLILNNSFLRLFLLLVFPRQSNSDLRLPFEIQVKRCVEVYTAGLQLLFGVCQVHSVDCCLWVILGGCPMGLEI